ncbi:hypothetical protein QYM36_010515 [Artemia franciscana]|uniref:Uncharacterized protein n=1 Tax=Artemia franciscana TaxID=6661 RepID=A0AA88I0R5_ARTSF|nr:hypothetical protein QYM36_010515 [Artemia franciscana]
MYSLRRSAIRNYYSEKFSENAGDAKGTWQIINDAWIGERKNYKTDEIFVNGKRVVEPKHIVDEFCEYFSKIRTSIRSDIAQSSDLSVNEGFIDEIW